MKKEKCIVKNCINHSGAGKITNGLCTPCRKFIMTNKKNLSQAYSNHLYLCHKLTIKLSKKGVKK